MCFFVLKSSYVGLKGNEKCLAPCLVIGTESRGILIVYDVYLICREEPEFLSLRGRLVILKGFVESFFSLEQFLCKL